jgi:rhamnosyltransferase
VAGPDAHPFEVAKRLFNYPAAAREVSYADGRSLGYKAAFVSNAFAAYRRDALVRAGLFRERQLMCEDVCAAASLLLLGWRLAYRSDAVVRHAHPVSPLRSFRRAFDIGASHRQQIWILEHFGKVNREGARFVRFGISHLRRSGATARIPSFLLWCAAKQLGYQLGFRYELLPPPLRPALSAFPAWWSRGAAPAPSPTPLPELTLAASSSSATA